MQLISLLFKIVGILILTSACTTPEQVEDPSVNPTENEVPVTPLESFVEVTDVSVSGNANAYTFNVKLSSKDTGCDQYADWWEVLDENGMLIYRRVLGHSHVNEQPFTRSGGPVNIDADQIVWVRGHMNNSSFGHFVFKGSFDGGFAADSISVDFAKDVESQEPLPSDCAF